MRKLNKSQFSKKQCTILVNISQRDRQGEVQTCTYNVTETFFINTMKTGNKYLYLYEFKIGHTISFKKVCQCIVSTTDTQKRQYLFFLANHAVFNYVCYLRNRVAITLIKVIKKRSLNIVLQYFIYIHRSLKNIEELYNRNSF